MVTGIDLVKEQLRVAAGEPLSFRQEDVKITGHAIECRVNAEDPFRGFRPSPGKVGLYVPPGGPGVRVDSHLFSGYRIPPHYDSMIAKLICHRADPRRGDPTPCFAPLGSTVIEGIQTTIPLHMPASWNTGSSRAATVDTGFLDTQLMPRLGRRSEDKTSS